MSGLLNVLVTIRPARQLHLCIPSTANACVSRGKTTMLNFMEKVALKNCDGCIEKTIFVVLV